MVNMLRASRVLDQVGSHQLNRHTVCCPDGYKVEMWRLETNFSANARADLRLTGQ